MSTEKVDLEIARIKQNISDCYNKLADLGITVQPSNQNLTNLSSSIADIQTKHLVTQDGDNLVTSYGANINYEGKGNIRELMNNTTPYVFSMDGDNFLVADDGSFTVKFSLDDLKTWINTPTPTTKQRLVSVADNFDTNKLVLYTDDGINWNTSTMPNSRNWGNVFYGNGKFIVPCSGSDIYAYSTDGINWTEGTLPISGNWQGGAYGNGKYVMYDYSSLDTASKICYSDDGLTWNYYTFPAINPYYPLILRAIIFDGTQFILAGRQTSGGGGELIGKSADGINWILSKYSNSVQTSNFTRRASLLYYNGKYVCCNALLGTTDTASNQYVNVSIDLENWTSVQFNYNNVYPITACGINNEIKIFSGRSSFSQQAAGYINVNSTGTVTFVGSSVPRLNYQGGANVINDRAVVIGYGSDQYIYSTDGTTWSTGTLPASSGWWGSCVGEVTV